MPYHSISRKFFLPAQQSKNLHTRVDPPSLQIQAEWGIPIFKMEAFKSSLIIFALLAALTQAASFPDINLRSQADILTAPTWEDSMTPNAYISRRDATCIPSTQINSAISSLPMFPTAVQFLNLKGMTPYSLLLFCQSSPQKYYLFLYATSSGLVRLNVYSDRGYSKVTSASIMDTDLFINQQFGKQF